MYVWNAGAVSVWSYSQWDVQKPAKGWELTEKKAYCWDGPSAVMKLNCGIKNPQRKSGVQVDLNKAKAQVEPDFPSRDYTEKPRAVLTVSLVETLEVTHVHGLCHYCSTPVNGE